MSAQHTPGPWGRHPHMGGEHETDCRDDHGGGFLAHTIYVGAPGDVMVAELAAYKHQNGDGGGYPRVTDFDVNRANARLIAAAPLLLEVAIELLASKERSMATFSDAAPFDEAQVERARAAIAAAKGQA